VGKIFRLSELLPERKDEPLRIRLHHHTLDSNLKYEALSYIWGPVWGTHKVSCNGSSLPLRNNLYNCLSKLRRSRPRAWLWIDINSINELDVAEKERTLLLMPEIFLRAERTIC
jgi:hypothetical protein